jgi:hypothetical protein
MEKNNIHGNNWKRFHDSLERGIAKKYKAEIERVLNISQAAFYRKIKAPEELSIAEKQAISRVYNLIDWYLFPELTPEEELLPTKQTKKKNR